MKINNIIKRIFLTQLFLLISFLVPKKKFLWIFGAWQGKSYNDNSKYLFEYINLYKKNIKAVWISKDKNIVNYLLEKGFDACYYPSLRSLCNIFRAQAIFQTEGNIDIGNYPVSRTKIIQLWHGFASKKLQWNKHRYYNRIEKCILNFITDNHKKSYWMVASKMNIEIYNQIFDIPESQFFLTGYSRNDSFVNKPTSQLMKKIRNRYPNNKIVIYLPTHRNFGTHKDALTSISELTMINEYMNINKMVLIYKPHFHELENLKKIEEQFSNIIFPNDPQYSDLYEYLYDCDLLISDYSSVIYDFLSANKPIVLFPYDLEDYQCNDAGVFDFYFEYPVGPVCFSWYEVVCSILELLENDSWINQRQICKEVFNPFDDGLSSERIYNKVLEILGFPEL